MGTPKLPADYRDFLSSLNESRVNYILIGGFAVSLHGYIRPTQDIDIWIEDSPANIEKLRQVLCGFLGMDPGVDVFPKGKRMLRMGSTPFRIEVLLDLSGVSFAECRPRAAIRELDGVQVPLISLEDLIQNKVASGRAHDRADVDELKKGLKKLRKSSSLESEDATS